MTDDRPTVQVNLRLSPEQLEAVDKARPSTIPRQHWIRGAIVQRLERQGVKISQEAPE